MRTTLLAALLAAWCGHAFAQAPGESADATGPVAARLTDEARTPLPASRCPLADE